MLEYTELLNLVNSYYESSFNILVGYTLGLFAVIGAIIPIGISFFQNKSFKKENIKLKEELKTELETELKEILDTHYNNIKISYGEDLKRIESSAEGKLFHTIVSSEYAKSNYIQVIESGISSSIAYIKCKDENNLQSVLRMMTYSLTKINSLDISERINIENNFKDFIMYLKTINDNGRYIGQIEELQKNMNTAKTRKKE